MWKEPRLEGDMSAFATGDRPSDHFLPHISSLSLDPHELQYTLRTKLDYERDPSGLPDFIASQVHFIGLYDGHGGSTAS
ncbi:hypothetical protein BDM02DRAFT_3199201 [Thelephora ganbajun]|uniref:Uncharacterized protein n=1 Tax=Thelephora ganbajun TaxID=370292 RepID=A0ACB6Z9B9_THEGA|nr:hypothetical protein BDM02DRAFT_3199201 [Thelephora ganbajun]